MSKYSAMCTLSSIPEVENRYWFWLAIMGNIPYNTHFRPSDVIMV